MIIELVLLLILAISSFATDSTVKCFSCKNVMDPSLCTTVTSCLQDEVCYVETTDHNSGISTYTFGCANKHLRGNLIKIKQEADDILAKLTINHQACKDLRISTNGFIQIIVVGTVVGKRFSNGLTSCSVCCGDSLCNNEQCFALTRTLKQLWKTGHLNLETLSYKQ